MAVRATVYVASFENLRVTAWLGLLVAEEDWARPATTDYQMPGVDDLVIRMKGAFEMKRRHRPAYFAARLLPGSHLTLSLVEAAASRLPEEGVSA
jgi:hypothetical protein